MLNFRPASLPLTGSGPQNFKACNLKRVASFFPDWPFNFKTSEKHFGLDQCIGKLREDLALSGFYSPYI